MPETVDANGVFKHFSRIIQQNMGIYNMGKPTDNLGSHILTFIPNSRAVGSFTLS